MESLKHPGHRLQTAQKRVMANKLLVTKNSHSCDIFLELPPLLPPIDELLPLPIPATLSGHLLHEFPNLQELATSHKKTTLVLTTISPLILVYLQATQANHSLGEVDALSLGRLALHSSQNVSHNKQQAPGHRYYKVFRNRLRKGSR